MYAFGILNVALRQTSLIGWDPRAALKMVLIAFLKPTGGWQLLLSSSLSQHIKGFYYKKSTWSEFISAAQSKVERCLMFSHNGDSFTRYWRFRNKQMKGLKDARIETVTIKNQHEYIKFKTCTTQKLSGARLKVQHRQMQKERPRLPLSSHKYFF